jgi:penicillin V acylase-like amidase (Ntn superfamily)
MRRILVLTLFLILLYSVPVAACTTFAVTDSRGDIPFVGKSYDWGTQAAMVVANMKGITKKAFPVSSGLLDPNKTYTPKVWRSQFNSITFAQYGRDIPISGMNDQGLVVETMELDLSYDYGYVPEDATQYISSIQWVQYILDNFASVTDFLNEPKDYAIVSLTIYAHFMVCDPTQCAAVEFGTPDTYVIKKSNVPLNVTALGGLPDSPFVALANDYSSCSLHGGVNDSSPLLSLEDYTGFGGTRPIPVGSLSFAQLLPQGTWRDYACRLENASWGESDSVERFVRAAAGSKALSLDAQSGKNATVDDIFQVLNTVFEEGTVTGGAKWQAAYDMVNKKIYWRTVADGCSLETGFTGAPRSIGFDDFDFGDGECTIPDNTKVVNIDQAPSCDGPLVKTDCRPTPDETCNPIPSLPSCVGSGCTISAYDESYNQKLVRFASEKTWIHRNLNGLTGMIAGLMPDADDATKKAVLYNIWGGYPRGFTRCRQDVTAEDSANLYLWGALGPYLNPQVLQKSLPASYEADAKNTDYDLGHLYLLGNDTGIDVKLSYAMDVSFSGLNKTALSDITVAKDSPSDKVSFDGTIPPLKAGVSAAIQGWVGGIAAPFTGNSISLSFSLTEAALSGSGHGIYVSDDLGAPPICFDNRVWKIETFNLDAKMLDVKCSVHLDPVLKAVIFGASSLLINENELAKGLCAAVGEQGKGFILGTAGFLVKSAVNLMLIKKYPCSAPAAAAPVPPQLAAGWGGLEGQYVTARAGHTYVLEGVVTTDRDSDASEFATFSEAAPGSGDLLRIDTIRMRSLAGSNKVSTLWTPSSEGDRDLFFDVFHWNEPIDEVSPAVLHVHVLPAGGPSSWLGLTKEGLSSKLKEVK